MAVFGYTLFPSLTNPSVRYLIDGFIYVHIFAFIVCALLAIRAWIEKIACKDQQIDEVEELEEIKEELRRQAEGKEKTE
jgi:hypothetical protein